MDVGRTADEIAVELNRTHPAIYSRLQRLYRKSEGGQTGRTRAQDEKIDMENSEDPLVQFGLDANRSQMDAKGYCCKTLMDHQRGSRIQAN
jgi:hypothetical protein